MRVDEALASLHAASEMLRRDHPEVASDDELWLSSIESCSDGLDLAEMLSERVIHLLSLQAAALERARALQARAKRFEADEERLRAIILALVDAAGGRKVVRSGVTLSPRNTPAKAVAVDAAATPDEYMVEVVTRKPDAKAIRDALEIGAQVDGWYLQNSSRSLSILVR